MIYPGVYKLIIVFLIGDEMTVTCNLCGSKNCEIIADKLRYETDRIIARCSDCTLQFLYPKMEPEEERIFYEQEYGNIYSNEKGTTPAQLFDNRLPDAALYYEWVRDYLNPDDVCLEVGCASGYFLATIKDHVRSVAGVETHKLLKEYCQKNGIDIFEDISEIPSDTYDKVFLFFVLEHLGEPLSYLEEIKRILKPNGLFFFVVPNVDDALLTLFDIPAFKQFYYTPAHQFYYSKKTLEKLFDMAQLNDYQVFHLQRYDLSNHMHWMMFGRPGGVGKYNHVFSNDLLNEYAKNLIEKDISDTLFAIVKK